MVVIFMIVSIFFITPLFVDRISIISDYDIRVKIVFVVNGYLLSILLFDFLNRDYVFFLWSRLVVYR